MPQDKAYFPWTDAWLLLSLIYSREPADRERINSIGEYINHAIFTDEEVEGGLARLRAAEYVVEEGESYAASPAVLDWYDRAGPKRRYVHKDQERVREFLDLQVPD
jgi:hypothetical protein